MNTATNLAYREDVEESFRQYPEGSAEVTRFVVPGNWGRRMENAEPTVLEMPSTREEPEIEEDSGKAAFSRAQLEAMSRVDPMMVDKSTLVDVENITVDESVSKEEKMRSFMEQVQNPYCYLDHGVVVKLSFSGTGSMEDVLKACIRSAASTAGFDRKAAEKG